MFSLTISRKSYPFTDLNEFLIIKSKTEVYQRSCHITDFSYDVGYFYSIEIKRGNGNNSIS